MAKNLEITTCIHNSTISLKAITLSHLLKGLTICHMDFFSLVAVLQNLIDVLPLIWNIENNLGSMTTKQATNVLDILKLNFCPTFIKPVNDIREGVW